MPVTTTVYAGLENGLLALTNVGNRWQATPLQLVTKRVVDVASSVDNPACIFAAADDGLFKTDDNGRRWHQVLTGHVSHIALNRRHSGGVWTAVHPAGLFFGSDDGASWQDLSHSVSALADAADWYSPEPPFEPRISALKQPPQSPDEVWLGVSVGGVYRSVDDGESWQAINDGLDEDVLALAFLPDEPGLCLVGTGAGVFRLRAGAGGVWDDVSAALAGKYVLALVGSSAGGVWAIASGTPPGNWVENATSQVYRSADYGDVWHDAPLPTAEYITALAVQTRYVFCGTQSGAIYQHKDNAGWKKIGQAKSAVHALHAVRIG